MGTYDLHSGPISGPTSGPMSGPNPDELSAGFADADARPARGTGFAEEPGARAPGGRRSADPADGRDRSPEPFSEPVRSGAPISGGPARAGGPLDPDRHDGREPAPLDGRTIFFLFVGSAVCACLLFAGGVFVGRRVERRAAAQVVAPITDPLAVLDELANAEESLTFHHVLGDRRPGPGPGPGQGQGPRPGRPGAAAEGDAARPGAAAARPGAHAGATLPLIGPPAPPSVRPRYTLHGPTVLSREREDAQPLLRRLREAGYQPKLVEIPPTVPGRSATYRVQVGDFGAVDAAQPVKEDLERKFRLVTSVVKQ